MAECSRVQRQVREVDPEDEGAWNDCYGSVSSLYFVAARLYIVELIWLGCVGSMAVGLGATAEEWEELKGNVDDSFWVMRIIGYPPLPNDHDGFSCGAHKSVSMFHLPTNSPLTTLPILRDYGCLTYDLPQFWV